MMNNAKHELASRMADVMLRHMKESDQCTADNLLDAGFTEKEIAEAMPLARGYASVRTIGRILS